MELAGKVALVTGGTLGIGRAIVDAFTKAGMLVAAAARDWERLEALREELEGDEHECLTCPCDVSRADDCRNLVDKTVERFGRIDVLVNNAGTADAGPIEDLDDDHWQRMFEVNLLSAARLTRLVFPHMKEAGGGYIINVASYAGTIGLAGVSAYGASKFGMVGLTESTLAEGTPHKIRASAICPGLVWTPLVESRGFETPPEEMIQPSDVAESCLFLLRMSGVTVVKRLVIERTGA